MRTLEARVLLDRPLDLDRDPRLHRQREQLAVVGGEGRRRPRRARALDVDRMPSFRACASSPRKRIASGEKPPQTSLMSTSTSRPPSSAAWYLAVRGTPSLRGATISLSLSRRQLQLALPITVHASPVRYLLERGATRGVARTTCSRGVARGATRHYLLQRCGAGSDAGSGSHHLQQRDLVGVMRRA